MKHEASSMNDLSVSLIQGPLYWEDAASNLEMLDARIDALPSGTELVLLPEMFSTGFTMHPERCAEDMNGSAVSWMQRKAREKNIALAGSLAIREGGRYFNRLLWVLPTGIAGYYDKRHLFAFAGEDRHYTAGDGKLVARLKGWKICLSICYDLRFPVWLRQPPERENRYDLLVCVANWPESRSEAWHALLRARAVENQCYVAGVNRTGTDGEGIGYAGGSSLIDPAGRELATAGEEPGMLRDVLRRDSLEDIRNQFPFLDDADRFYIER
jgi:predicted amidohydrolase